MGKGYGLKPCPFCGGRAKVEKCLSDSRRWRLTHTCCDRHPHIDFYHYFDTPQQAAEFWNKRTPSAKTSFQEDLEFFVNDCTEAQLKALYERVGEKIKAKWGGGIS